MGISQYIKEIGRGARGAKPLSREQAADLFGQVLDAQGLVTLHRDYWDAAEELYEKLPVVGAMMRWLKSRANSY